MQLQSFLCGSALVLSAKSEMITYQPEGSPYISVFDYETQYDWYHASAHCTLMFGTSLASIHSVSDQEVAYASMEYKDQMTWIGLIRVDNEWTWIDRTNYDHNISWAPGEPNNADDNENCVQFFADYELSYLHNASAALTNDCPCAMGLHQFVCNAPQDTSNVADTQGDAQDSQDGPKIVKVPVDANNANSSENDLVGPFIAVTVLLCLCCCGVVAILSWYLCYHKVEELEVASKRREAKMFEILRNKSKGEPIMDQSDEKLKSDVVERRVEMDDYEDEDSVTNIKNLNGTRQNGTMMFANSVTMPNEADSEAKPDV